jgi:hypothetical protein
VRVIFVKKFAAAMLACIILELIIIHALEINERDLLFISDFEEDQSKNMSSCRSALISALKGIKNRYESEHMVILLSGGIFIYIYVYMYIYIYIYMHI